MTQSLTQIDALRAESSALLAEAAALRASRAQPDRQRALALYGRATELAGEYQLRLLAWLKSTTTPGALGARTWVEFVSAQLKISPDEAQVRLRDVATLGP